MRRALRQNASSGAIHLGDHIVYAGCDNGGICTSSRVSMWIYRPSHPQTRETPTQQDYLILAVALLQTIGLFHQTLELRDSSNVWHGMLVTVSMLLTD